MGLKLWGAVRFAARADGSNVLQQREFLAAISRSGKFSASLRPKRYIAQEWDEGSNGRLQGKGHTVRARLWYACCRRFAVRNVPFMTARSVVRNLHQYRLNPETSERVHSHRACIPSRGHVQRN
jgi:hypothetical protein